MDDSQNQCKKLQLCSIGIDLNTYRAIKLTSKAKNMKIGEFIAEMFVRHKDEYLNEATKPLEHEIDRVTKLLNTI